MKNDKHQQAKNLFFQTNLSKTEIAIRLGVNRRTVMLWCQQGNWERLKQSSENLPSMVAEKCYFLLDHYASHLLSSNGVISTFGPREANAINQMATSIKKLKNRSAINEAMEMFNFFLEYVKKNVPEMHELVTPLVEGYIATRRDTNVDAFVPHNFTADAKMDETIREQQIIEQWKDEDDQDILNQEYREFLQYREQKAKGNNPPDKNDSANDDITPNQPKDPSPTPTTQAQHIECHGEPRRTMTAEEQTTVEYNDNTTQAQIIECHGAPVSPAVALAKEGRTMTAEQSTATEQVQENRTRTTGECHPELVEGIKFIHGIPGGFSLPPFARRSFSEGGSPSLNYDGGSLNLTPDSDTDTLTRTPTLKRISTPRTHPAPTLEQPRPISAPALNTQPLPLSPLQTFITFTFLNATEPKREPNCWTRLYKDLRKIFPDDITTLEEFDQIKFPPERREEVLNILRTGTPIPGFEKLQLQLIHADINKNKNNQNLAA